MWFSQTRRKFNHAKKCIWSILHPLEFNFLSIRVLFQIQRLNQGRRCLFFKQLVSVSEALTVMTDFRVFSSDSLPCYSSIPSQLAKFGKYWNLKNFINVLAKAKHRLQNGPTKPNSYIDFEKLLFARFSAH